MAQHQRHTGRRAPLPQARSTPLTDSRSVQSSARSRSELHRRTTPFHLGLFLVALRWQHTDRHLSRSGDVDQLTCFGRAGLVRLPWRRSVGHRISEIGVPSRRGAPPRWLSAVIAILVGLAIGPGAPARAAASRNASAAPARLTICPWRRPAGRPALSPDGPKPSPRARRPAASLARADTVEGPAAAAHPLKASHPPVTSSPTGPACPAQPFTRHAGRRSQWGRGDGDRTGLRQLHAR